LVVAAVSVVQRDRQLLDLLADDLSERGWSSLDDVENPCPVDVTNSG
jgi:hypothetical protein